MSQTASQPVPAPAPLPAPTGATTAGSRVAHQAAIAGRPQGLTEDVPRLLTRLQAIAVTTCVVFGVLAGLLQLLALQAAGRAADNTEQLVRVQQIQSSLFRADALATNGFLRAGIEDPEQRAEYDDAIDSVLRQVADAAEAQPADRAVLAELNTEVASYVAGITQARDNNRQGFPIGAQYLTQAGSGLRADAVPILQALVDANTARAEDEMDGQNTLPLFLVGLAAVAVLWWVNRQVARRFRRRFNVGLVLAVLAIAVVTLAGVAVSAAKSTSNDDLRAGSFTEAIRESTARTAANDAKANESIRLIKRGSGATTEPAWTDAAAVVQGNASPRTLPLWETYAERHTDIATADDGGDWNGAVALATSTEPDSSSAALTEFDQASQEVVARAATSTVDSLRSGTALAVALVVLSLLVGLGAAGAVTWGLGLRRKEYA